MSTQIFGENITPCFITEEDFENSYKQSVFYIEKDYMQEYQKYITAMSHVANIAKVYILKNWQKVSDWKDLNVTITHGPTGKTTTYYNYTPHVNRRKGSSKTWDEIMNQIDVENKEKHNPLFEVNRVVLDPTDGDFSITVNGDQEHWWIGDEEVIIIADYIECYLKNLEKK